MLCIETAEGSTGTGAVGIGLSGAESGGPEETERNEENGVSEGGMSAMAGGATGGVVLIRCSKMDEGSPLVGVAALRGFDGDL
jgi:hypothetical protein